MVEGVEGKEQQLKMAMTSFLKATDLNKIKLSVLIILFLEDRNQDQFEYEAEKGQGQKDIELWDDQLVIVPIQENQPQYQLEDETKQIGEKGEKKEEQVLER